MSVTLSSIAQRNSEIVEANIDGETVMMSIENGNYYGLNTIGSKIWEHIDTPLSVAELCDRLTEEYDVSLSQCQSEVIAFLNSLNEQSIIMVTD
ncbi:lasso peptide biosynthesis PqqD family chaperone [Teredinibacter sp. KSP-S5-2]|uniref:lasso peptide biosynthesis PqqD family chaperone n=1 Tax=Teredinibacter sp. KSP-S5-2 TaxID=3034506 RepID=UPI002934514F|nr:lasso peptide biosynthesis PqqD family chaperone [Teredinibacter sp. KSP-S5-2]WNO09096.1 lasso peptide biosynthesis PqqD family chaperone [Teredinibacter sp. KSP-S5-2]